MAKLELVNTENPYTGPYPSVFKKIDSRDVNTNTFLAHKEWSVVSGSSTSSISVSRGLYQDINTLLKWIITNNNILFYKSFVL